MNNPTKFCPKCNTYHRLHYVVDSASHRSLVVECPLGLRHIRMVDGLKIPTLETKRKRKLDAQAKQSTLF